MAYLNYAEISKLLKADFDTGRLFWLPRIHGVSASGVWISKSKCAAWNVRYAGQEALASFDAHGYLRGKILSKYYSAHRVIWMLAYGSWPSKFIDHINGDQADNRIVNLRDVSHAENGRNQKRHKRNVSGVTGVGWHARAGKWQARITVNGQLKYIGSYDDIASAEDARKQAEVRYGYHKNHGMR